LETLLLYLALGIVVGIISGLFGVGGGLIVVPALVLIFQYQGISGEVLMHLAIGTSLATIVATSISSALAHNRHGMVLWPVVCGLAPALVGGALLGAVLADRLSSTLLQGLFAVYTLTAALQLAFFKPSPRWQLPKRAGLLGVGTVIGTISSLVGIGGGSLTTPFLVWCNKSVREAVTTSAVCGVPIAIAGATGFLISGLNEQGLPAMSNGYIYWPAWLGISIGSVCAAPLGARFAHRLPQTTLKKLFALLLAIIAAKMLWSAQL